MIYNKNILFLLVVKASVQENEFSAPVESSQVWISFGHITFPNADCKWVKITGKKTITSTLVGGLCEDQKPKGFFFWRIYL